ncbi:FG-GAP repeat domain-containing protein, partial [Chloroflexota bacterium]
VLWDYPRATDVAVERGDFCGDDAEDLLICSRTYPYGRGDRLPTTRVLYAMDGATRDMVWSYEVPFEEFATIGGISGIQITPDLDGDGKEDIAGFIQPPEWKGGEEESGEDSQIILISGRDGAILLKQPVVTETYYGVWEELDKNPSLVEDRLWDQFEARMEQDFPREWQKHEDEQRRQFEEQLQWELDDGRQQGWTQAEIAAHEQQRRQLFEQQLEEEQEGWRVSWREQFEEEELPRHLEDLQRNMEESKEWRRIDKWIVSLDVAQFREGGPAPVCLMVRTPYERYLLGPQGQPLLIWTFEPGHYQDPFGGGETELPSGVKPGLQGAHWNWQLVLDDLNGDGGDDLATFTDQEIYISTTDIDVDTGDLDFELYQTIEVQEGIDSRQGWLADDLDGDGVREIFYLRHQEDRPQMLTFVSPVTGERLLEIEYDQNSSTINPGCADFDSDGYADTLLFRRWVEGKEGPKIEIRSGRDESVVWELNDYREEQLFHMTGYEGSIMPACPIADVTGDGVADLALIKNLTWQPGAQVVVFDVARGEEVKQIVIEEIDPTRHRDLRWHPGLLVNEIADVNSDGYKELVAIIALGDTDKEKKWQLMVIDVRSEEVLADFLLAGSEFIEPGEGSEFGMIAPGGEVYLLNVASDFQITAPSEMSSQTSPLTVRWSGVAEGDFSEVFVDGVKVAQTNEVELSLALGKGEHELMVRSLDEYGRGIYRTVRFTVEKSSSPLSQAILWLALACIIALAPALSGFIIRHYRRRMRRG